MSDENTAKQITEETIDQTTSLTEEAQETTVIEASGAPVDELEPDPNAEAPEPDSTDSADDAPAEKPEGKPKWSRNKKIAAGVVCLAIVAGLGAGAVYYNNQQEQAAIEQQAAKDAAQVKAAKEAAERLAKEPRPVEVSVKAEGWKPENGAFTLLIKDSDGKEAAKLPVMPEGNGGMAVEDAIEQLPEEQFDDAKEAYTAEGVDGVADSPVLELAPGGYTAELADLPTLEDGATYKVPEPVEFTVEPKDDEADDSTTAKVAFELETIDPEDEEAVEAAIEALPESEREAARQTYQQKAEQKQQIIINNNAGGNANSGSTGSGSSGNSGSGSGGSGSGNSSGGGNGGGGATQPEKPADPPAHVHNKVWSDGILASERATYTCSACYAKFYSTADIDAHCINHIESGENATCIYGNEQQWSKEPGYYCSGCGAYLG